MGVSGRPTRAWALSIDSEMPPCSVQPKDNNAAHVKAEAARAVFRACFMSFLRCAKNINVARVPTSPCQIEFRFFSGNVDNVHVTAYARHRVALPASPLLQRGHVWTTPALQGESDVRLAVGCKSCVRPVCAAP